MAASAVPRRRPVHPETPEVPGPLGPSARSTAQRWITTLDGHRLRQLRRQRGLSQASLAALAGISQATVARLELRPAVPCRGRTLARLAAALREPPVTLTPAASLNEAGAVPRALGESSSGLTTSCG